MLPSIYFSLFTNDNYQTGVLTRILIALFKKIMKLKL